MDKNLESPISASLEDYLEAIFWLVREQRVARSKDIAERMGVTKSSVTGALRQLTANGYINYDPYSFVTLTESGEELAEMIAHRHQVLADFLERVLGVEASAADANACRMEHAIDNDVLKRLIRFVKFLDSEQPDVRAWMQAIEEKRP